MPLDQYSPCPCGSGKKMKFCKCLDQPQDYDKLIRLIEGGQELAAMDRINQLLAKTPNAAWLLALKGELSLGMQELETFKETANRFMKLKPDNPLALIMKSLASSLSGEPAENAANYLLEGLSESRESLPAMTLMALEMLIQSLGRSGKLSLAGYWGDLQQLLAGEQRAEGESVLHDSSLNLIAKVPGRLVDDPPGTPWKERLAEVTSLSKTFRFAQAETKLRSILRDFPDQPGPLSHLLRAQMAQLNQNGAQATAQKLADHLSIPPTERAYFAALAFELESEQKSIQPETISRYCEVDSLERIVEALVPLEHIESVEGEASAQVRLYYAAMVSDEVPARGVYSIFDRSIQLTVAVGDQPTSDATDAVPRSIASLVATVILFAKQTDKPARALFLATRFPDYQQRIDETLAILQMGADIDGAIPPLSRTYVDFLGRPKLVAGRREPPSIQENGIELKHDFLNLPFKMFDGATPLEAAQHERHRAKLLGLLCHLEGEQSIIVPTQTIGELFAELELERPAAEAEIVSGNFRITNILDLDRIDLTQLSDQHLQGVMVRSMNLGASRVFYHCSLAIRQRPGLADHLQTQVVALSALKMLASSFQEKIVYCEQLIELLVKANAPVGQAVLELVGLLNADGRPREAEQTLIQAATNFPEDPYLMNFIQHVMQQQRGGSPRGGGGSDELASRMMQHASRSEPESQSGLLLPGRETSGSAGESKLWLPGS